MSVVVRQIEAEGTHALRRRVLRDGRADAVVVFPGDDDPATIHFGAFDESGGGAVAIASLYRAPVKDTAHAEGVQADRQFQFRGMASAPEVRGRGCADAVLRAMAEHVRGAVKDGRALLWCNARTGAVGFYERFGMRVVSGEFEIPGVGPHKVMNIVLQ